MSHAASTDELVADLRRGDRKAIARALNLVEDRRPSARAAAAALLVALDVALDVSLDQEQRGGHLIGVTGPPGVGKSTLVSALISRWRRAGKTVGVLAVDPTSPISGGALLGDRIRMQRDDADDGVFVRSLAGRGEMGGLSAAVYPMSRVLLAAGFDIVVVETIGVGQTEVDVVDQTDTTLLVAQPASGDTIQFLKAGILELPALVAVNKADLGQSAQRAANELKACLPTPEESWAVEVLLCSATSGDGIDALGEALTKHARWTHEQEPQAASRRRQAEAWVIQRLRVEFGRHGLERLGGLAALKARLGAEGSLFAAHETIRRTLLDTKNTPL